MDVFKLKTLTINGITKICDNKIYVKNNDKIIYYQWYEHQLQYVMELLGLSIKDSLTNLNLTNEQMGKQIKSRLERLPAEKRRVYSENKLLDKRYGIVPITDNTVITDRLGGTPNFFYKINNGTGEINYQPNFKYQHEASSVVTTIKKVKKLRINKSKHKLKHKPTSSDLPHHLDKFGLLKYRNNSCFADSIVMMLLLPIFKGKKVSKFVEKEILNKSDLEIADYQAQFMKKSNEVVEAETELINKFRKSFRTIQSNLSNGTKEIYLDSFLQSLDEHKGISQEQESSTIGDGSFHDEKEFLDILTRIFNINIDLFEGNVLTKYYFKKPNAIEPTYENVFKKKIEDIVDKTKVPFIKHSVNHPNINILFRSIKNYEDGFPTDQDEIHLSDLLNMNVIYTYDDENPFYLFDEKKLGRRSVSNKALGEFYLKETGNKISDEEAMENHGVQKIKTFVRHEKVNNVNSMFIRIERKTQTQKFIPTEYFALYKKRLTLRAITVHVNARSHFNLRFFDSFSKLWYKYDDQDGKLMKIGDFKELIKEKAVLLKSSIYWYNVD